MHTLQKPYLCSPQIAQGWWAVHTLQKPYLCSPQIQDGGRCTPYRNLTFAVRRYATRMVGGAHPTETLPGSPRMHTLQGWCAVHTLQKPYLCTPQIARLVRGAHPTETLPLQSADSARLVRGAHPTETLPLHSADRKDGGRTPYRNAHPTRPVGGAQPYKAGARCTRLQGWCAVHTLQGWCAVHTLQGWCAVHTLQGRCAVHTLQGWCAVHTLQKPYLCSPQIGEDGARCTPYTNYVFASARR